MKLAVADRFAEAWANASERVESHFEFAGGSLHFRVAGVATAEPLLRPFRHHRPALTTDPRMRIDAMPLEAAAAAAEGNCDTSAWQSALDLDAGHILAWLDTAAVPTAIDTAHPLLPSLRAWLHYVERPVVHATGVSHDGHGVLLVGPGGSGKTTALLACLQSGWQNAGDDFVALSLQGEPTLYSLYDTICVRPDALLRCPRAAAMLRAEEQAAGDEGKTMFFLPATRPQTRVLAAVATRLAGSGPSRLTPARPREILMLLLPPLLLLPGNVRPDMRALCEHLARLSCYTLDIGDDVENVPHLMRGVLP